MKEVTNLSVDALADSRSSAPKLWSYSPFSVFWTRVLGLCAFIFCLGFKPSEPYLSQFLICNQSTQSDYCDTLDENDCKINDPCMWSNNQCSITSCSNVPLNLCGNDDFEYCHTSSGKCDSDYCYKNFTEEEVNNDIYPWSTYAYFPFLILLGPYAEVFSYPIAILVGISGRVVTRFLLIYGNTLSEMQIMQVTYSMGTAAEDVFSGYIYYVVQPTQYTAVTSYIKSTAFISSLLSGFVGDILVVVFDYSIDTLMVISAAFVCIGVFIGFFVIGSTRMKYHLDTSFKKVSIKSKILTLKSQLEYITRICKKQELFYLVLYWLFGNAVFTIVYNYEVSVYEELNGSNEWNGSVLSIMLLGGSFGSLMPSYLQTGNMTVKRRSICLLIAEIVSLLSLTLAVYVWCLVATISFLTIFFTAWQFVNVVTYSQLALGLKEAQLSYSINTLDIKLISAIDSPMSDHDMDSSEHPLITDINPILPSVTLQEDHNTPDPPFSICIVAIAAICVLIQIIIQSTIFSGLQFDLYKAMLIVSYLFTASTIFHVGVSAILIYTS